MASRSRGLALITLLLTVAVAGCLGDDEPADPAASTGTGGDADAADGNATTPRIDRSATRPSVEGYVLDPANLPIPGAKVVVQNEGLETTVDERGRYDFAGLLDNEIYVLIAEASGYQRKAQQIVAVDDKVVSLNFTLDEIPTATPYTEVVERAGLIGCEALIQIGGDHGGDPTSIEQGCGAGDPNAVDVLQFDIPPGVAGIVVEVTWDSNQPLSDFLKATAETYGYGDLDTVFGSTIGSDPLKVEIPQDLVAKYYTGDGGGLKITMDASPADDDEQAAGAALSFQQSFTVFVSEFFVTPNPPSYSVFDGQEG